MLDRDRIVRPQKRTGSTLVSTVRGNEWMSQIVAHLLSQTVVATPVLG